MKKISDEKMIDFIKNYEVKKELPSYSDCLDALKYYKVNEFNIHAQDKNGDNLINIAVQYENFNLLLDFLEMGVDPTVTNKKMEDMRYLLGEKKLSMTFAVKAEQRGWGNFHVWENFTKHAHPNTLQLMFDLYLSKNEKRFENLAEVRSFLRRNGLLNEKNEISLYLSAKDNVDKYNWFMTSFEDNKELNSVFFNHFFRDKENWVNLKEKMHDFLSNREMDNNLKSSLRIRDIIIIANKSIKGVNTKYEDLDEKQKASFEMSFMLLEYIHRNWDGILSYKAENNKSFEVHILESIQKNPILMNKYMDIKLDKKEQNNSIAKLKI